MGFQIVNPKTWLGLLQLDDERSMRVNHFLTVCTRRKEAVVKLAWPASASIPWATVTNDTVYPVLFDQYSFMLLSHTGMPSKKF